MIEPTTEPIELSGAPVPVEEGENLEPLEHEALFGDEITSEKLVEKQATIAVVGATPFEDDGNEMEHHKIVATEIVADPIAAHEPEPIVSHWRCVPTIPRTIFRRRKDILEQIFSTFHHACCGAFRRCNGDHLTCH